MQSTIDPRELTDVTGGFSARPNAQQGPHEDYYEWTRREIARLTANQDRSTAAERAEPLSRGPAFDIRRWPTTP